MLDRSRYRPLVGVADARATLQAVKKTHRQAALLSNRFVIVVGAKASVPCSYALVRRLPLRNVVLAAVGRSRLVPDQRRCRRVERRYPSGLNPGSALAPPAPTVRTVGKMAVEFISSLVGAPPNLPGVLLGHVPSLADETRLARGSNCWLRRLAG
jgi:hypothetical protein